MKNKSAIILLAWIGLTLILAGILSIYGGTELCVMPNDGPAECKEEKISYITGIFTVGPILLIPTVLILIFTFLKSRGSSIESNKDA